MRWVGGLETGTDNFEATVQKVVTIDLYTLHFADGTLYFALCNLHFAKGGDNAP